jgi:uncharacterized protein YbjT (DUF2867 family)
VAALAATRPGIAANATLDLVGPQAVRDREILERAARRAGRNVRIRSLPIPLLRTMLMVRGLFQRGGFSAAVLDVITADTKMDPVPAASALGMTLTGLDAMTEPGSAMYQG